MKLNNILKDNIKEQMNDKSIKIDLSNETHRRLVIIYAKTLGLHFDIDSDDDFYPTYITPKKLYLESPKDFIILGNKLTDIENKFSISIAIVSVENKNNNSDRSTQPLIIASIS